MLGLKEGLEGNIRRVTPKVFLLTPGHVAVNDEEAEDGAEIGDELLIRPNL
jgi:cell division inhibitor SepF